MKKILFLAVIAAAFVFTGCTSVNTSDGATAIPQPCTDGPGYTATFAKKTARVSGAADVKVLFGIFAWGAEGFADNAKFSIFSILPSAENFAKSAAVYNTCQKNKVDTLLGTRYTLTSTDYFVYKTIKCEVAGYPATMTGLVKKVPYAFPNGKIVWLAEKPTMVK